MFHSMWRRSLFAFLIASMLFPFISCFEHPVSPYQASNAKIYMTVKSPVLQKIDGQYIDSVGDSLNIGVNTNLPQFVDSVVINVISETDSIEGRTTFKNISDFQAHDTMWYKMLFKTGGKKSIISQAFIQENNKYSDTIEINVFKISAPVITTNPENQTVCLGAPATFSVSATGPGTLTYQWLNSKGKLSNSHFLGATTNTLIIDTVLTKDTGIYVCTITNESDSLISSSGAILMIKMYTVTFNSNGGSAIDSQKVQCNSVATAPAKPVKPGYSFYGWDSDSALTSVFIFSTPIIEPTTLFAKWKANDWANFASPGHTLIMRTDSSLWACGENGFGELGNGTTTNQSTPVRNNEVRVKSAMAGDNYSLIIKTDGSLWACGENEYGQLGNGTTTNQSIPVQIMSSGVNSVVAGENSSFIVKTDGSLWACGNNLYGQLGVGTANPFALVPVQIISGAVQCVISGAYSTFIIKTDGSLWACGNNLYGQLGNGTTTNQSTPAQIMSSGVNSVAIGWVDWVQTLIVKTDGSLWACGNNSNGQLGNGTTTNQSTPVQIMSSGVNSVVAGDNSSFITKTDGSLWACGNNLYGQLGNGTTTNQSTPIQIMSSGVNSVVAGDNSSFIIKTDGSLWACGNNLFGQLGNGTTTNQSTLVQIISSGVQSVISGGNSIFIKKIDESLWTCGNNLYGQLGNGTTTNQSVPTQVNLP